MKILHLTDYYPPGLGGIETHVAALAARQAARGDEVTVLTIEPEFADGRHSADEGPVKVLRVRSILAGLRHDMSSYDLVHAHISVVTPFASTIAGSVARDGVPVVVTVHSFWRGTGPVAGIVTELFGLRHAPVVWTAVSKAAAEHVSRQLPGRPPVLVLPNAVEVSARAASPAPGEPVRLITTMRLARRKRPVPLLDILAKINTRVETPVSLTFVGDGPQRRTLARVIRRRGLDEQVRITGRLEPHEVLGELAAADVYIAPALLESFGLAALEARCIGLPVVGRSGSGLTEYVAEGVDGFLCDSDEAIVERIVQLVEQPAERTRIAEHNRTVASRMTWEHALEQGDLAYDEAFAAAPRRARVRLLTRG